MLVKIHKVVLSYIRTENTNTLTDNLLKMTFYIIGA